MRESFDVIIVGSRCAGAPLGTLLARQGLKVAVLEQASHPKPVLSSHLIQADSLTFLDRLGVIDEVRATGARFMRRADTRLEDLRIVEDFPRHENDLGAAAVVRRHLLDPILNDAAVEAGADVRMDTKVTGVRMTGGRVTGVHAVHEGREHELRATLVVGADGRQSTIAQAVGARAYNVTTNERNYHWTFFEGADPAWDNTFIFHRWGDRMVWAGPADSGLYLVGVSPEAHERDRFREDLEGNLVSHMRACEPTARALANAHVADKVYGIRRFTAYFREAAGPGWVLVGDAGHFKDPAAGRGIGDAFLQADALAPAIVKALDGSGPPIDEAMAEWAMWRDRKFEGHYWMAAALGCRGALPSQAVEVVRGLHEGGRTDRYLDLFMHRSRYYDVFTLPRLAAATARVRLRERDRPAAARDVAALLGQELRRRWINRRHDFDATIPDTDGPETAEPIAPRRPVGLRG